MDGMALRALRAKGKETDHEKDDQDSSAFLISSDDGPEASANHYLREIARLLQRQEVARLVTEKNLKDKEETERWQPLGRLNFDITANGSVLAIFIAAGDAALLTYFNDLRSARTDPGPRSISDNAIVTSLYISLILSLVAVLSNSLISLLQFLSFQDTEDDSKDRELNFRAQYDFVKLSLLLIVLLVWPALTALVVAIVVLMWKEEGKVVASVATACGATASMVVLYLLMRWLVKMVRLMLRIEARKGAEDLESKSD